MNPYLKSLADVLAAIIVRQLVSASLEEYSTPNIRAEHQENINAHAGNKNARPTAIGRANYFRNEKDDTRKESFITKGNK